MRRLKEIICDLIFPKRCIFCNEITSFGHYVCENCKKAYPFKEMDICEGCGKIKKNCICNTLPSSVYKVYSSCAYEGAAITAIKKFKNDKEGYLGDDFADLLANVISNNEELLSFPYMTYIPMEKEKEAKRGHNMAKTLASKVAQRTGKFLIDPPIIKTDTSHFQHDLKGSERFKNAYLTFHDNFKKVEGDIILIDDVITTGATIAAASDILVKNGAKRVISLSIASTQKRERQ